MPLPWPLAVLMLALLPGAAWGNSAVMLGGNAGECDIARALLGTAPPGCPPPAPLPPPEAPKTPAAPPPAMAPAPAAPPPVAVTAPPPPREERRVSFQIQFDLGSARIRPESREILDRVARIMASDAAAGRTFHIVGHTDSTGTAAGNLVLSRKRAEAVRDYFVTAHAIPAARLSAEGKGQTAPLDPARPGDPQNRRVEIVATLP
ncbi:outer membrane protein OmpA-like peptidoglycan-associated protein [Azospirillum fermentarium]|uniref:OmpA family protein n=1 Tax=Azospirillum fermentarium TaxID=1233114 RepID=UPI0022265E67|nr:OmpA family protein [Azospirillum fermentarium]MCW2245258.1 outer membrane protein OmpA-like peptidoglycan-associated protein [Azospirillum fermentarium]